MNEELWELTRVSTAQEDQREKKSRKRSPGNTVEQRSMNSLTWAWDREANLSVRDSQAGCKDAWDRASVRESLGWEARGLGPGLWAALWLLSYLLPSLGGSVSSSYDQRWQGEWGRWIKVPPNTGTAGSGHCSCSGPAVTPAGWSHWTNVFPAGPLTLKFRLAKCPLGFSSTITCIWGWSFKIKPEEPSQKVLAFSDW